MKRTCLKLITSCLVAAVMLQACSTVDVKRITLRKFHPLSEYEEVQVFFDPPPGNYYQIAHLRKIVNTNDGKNKISEAFPELINAARKLGADILYIHKYEKIDRYKTAVHAVAIRHK